MIMKGIEAAQKDLAIEKEKMLQEEVDISIPMMT